MSPSKNSEIESRHLLRLSTVLYIDSTNEYSFSKETMIIKTIESIFIGNNNCELSVEDISNIIKEDYKMNFEVETILPLILKSNGFNSGNISNYSDEQKKYIVFNLNEDYFKDLCKKAKPNYLDMIIRKLFAENKHNVLFKGHTRKSIESIIYKFLHNLFVENFSNFSNLISKDNMLDNEFLKAISTTFVKNIVNEDEVFIINSFLEYDDPYKNKIIFDVATLAFEYCTTVSSLDDNSIKNIEYLNKDFYLDSNILYRVLGINGKNRMKKTHAFIKKCKENGQTLFISDATMKEFTESINHNCDCLSMYSPKANPEIYDIFGDNEMTKHYFEVRKVSAVSPAQYKAQIFKDFKVFMKDNNITIAPTIELNSLEHKKIIDGLTSQLIEFTQKTNKPKSKTKATHDTWIYYYLYINVFVN